MTKKLNKTKSNAKEKLDDKNVIVDNDKNIQTSILKLPNAVSNMEVTLNNITKLNSFSQLAYNNSALYNLSSIASKLNPAFDKIQNLSANYHKSFGFYDMSKDWNKNFIFPPQNLNKNLIQNLHSNLFYNVKGKNLDIASSINSFHNYKTLSVEKYLKDSTLNLSELHFGNKIGLDKISQDKVSDIFLNLSRKYYTLKETDIGKNKLFDITTEELYVGADLIESISDDEKFITEKEVLKNVIQYENEYNLNNFLPQINVELWNMWKGAIETFKSNNSDKVRQFITSIRELFTHLFHFLAPNSEIKKWTINEDHYHQGNPTRKCRLLYICRNISDENFNTFVNDDIKATLSFIDLFQRGTHSLKNNFTENQLIAIKSKAETTLKFILEIEFSSNKSSS